MTIRQHPATRYEVGDEIQGHTAGGIAITLARVVSPGTAQCTQPGCPTSIQRTSKGDLPDGVRAHYKTVHPERRLR